MQGGRPPRDNWATPGIIMQALTLVAMIFAGYLAFRDNIGQEVAALTTRIAVLETKVDALQHTVK